MDDLERYALDRLKPPRVHVAQRLDRAQVAERPVVGIDCETARAAVKLGTPETESFGDGEELSSSDSVTLLR